MKYKILLLFFGMFLISLISVTSAQTLKQNTESDVLIVCINNGYCSPTAVCNASIFDPDNIIIIDGVQATQSLSRAQYNITLNSTQTSKVGQYQVSGFCKDGSVAKEIDFNFEVTPNGKTYNTGDSLIYIFISIFLISMMIVFYKVSNSINYESWYEKIREKYITRNFVKWSLAAIGYNIMINGFIVYILLGLPIMLILMDLVFIFNITSITLYMQSLLYIYIVLIMVLGVVFLSFLQEWFMDFIKDIQDINWGVDKKNG